MSRPLRAFNYYGSKVASAHKYPAPTHDTIIEPFAGGAGYSLLHRKRNVILTDANPDVIDAWRYLITAPSEEIMRLPLLQPGESIPAELPRGPRLLIGWCNMISGAHPQSKLVMSSKRAPTSYWGAARRSSLARLSDEVRHWQAYVGSYDQAPNVEATWYIDPPYQGPAGRFYVKNSIDYPALGAWCQSRKGQVIVCEAPGATWLPFVESHSVIAAPRAGTKGRPIAREAMWVRP